MKINIFESVIKKIDSPIFLCPNTNVYLIVVVYLIVHD